MIRVEGHSHLYRDKKTGTIINTDTVGYQNYLKSSKIAEEKKKELDSMKEDIEDIPPRSKILITRVKVTASHQYKIDKNKESLLLYYIF